MLAMPTNTEFERITAKVLPNARQLATARDCHSYKREWLAKNLHLTSEVQVILAMDREYGVRLRLASNPSIKQEAQAILAQNREYGIRARLALNPNITEKTRSILENQDTKDAARA